MKIQCSYCQRFIEARHFKDHTKYNHKTKDVIYCCPHKSCRRTFSELKSLRNHIVFHKHKFSVNDMNDEIFSELQVNTKEPCPHDTTVNTSECVTPDLDSSSNLYLIKENCVPNIEHANFDVPESISSTSLHENALNIISTFYSDFTMSRIQVQRIINAFHEFLNDAYINSLKSFILASVDGNTKEKISGQFDELQTIFVQLGTEYKRLKEFKARGFYIEPEKILFGYLEQKNALGILENCKIYGQFIRLRLVLKAFFEVPGSFYQTMKYMSLMQSHDDGYIDNIVQTNFWKKKAFADDSKLILPLFLYQDDFESGNALGSHATIYKVSALYISVPCLPPQYRSKLDNIFLFQLSHSEDSKTFTKQQIYSKVIDELNALSSEGVKINVDGQTHTVFFKLALIIGDNLGLNGMLGYVESFSANRFCRFCKVTKLESKSLCFEKKCKMRTVSKYESDVQKDCVSSTGIKQRSIWNSVTGFHVAENYSVDAMHDLLEGVCKYDMCFILEYFILRAKLFSLETLNFKLQYFKYPSNCNQPPPIALECLKSKNLRMSASEVECLVLYGGVIFGDLVPEGNEHWDLFLLLRQILSHVLQQSCSNDTCDLLEILIEEHHNLFLKLFGNHLKPKYHLMVHYPRIMKLIGPLHHIWTMRYEAKHRLLKQSAAVSCNRRNICYTIALKNQLRFSHILSNHNVFKDSIVFRNGNDKVLIAPSIARTSILNGLKQIKYVILENVKYQVGTTVVIGLDEFPLFGTIQNIFRKKYCNVNLREDFSFIVREYNTLGQNDHIQAYQIEETHIFKFQNLNALPRYRPRNIHVFTDGNLYVSYDHHLL